MRSLTSAEGRRSWVGVHRMTLVPHTITATTFYVFTKALLEYLRASAEIIGTTTNLDAYSRTFLVVAATFIGEHEGNPMTVPDVSNYTGIPRATAQREVDRLEREGLLETERHGRRKVVRVGGRLATQSKEDHRLPLKRFLDRVAQLSGEL